MTPCFFIILKTNWLKIVWFVRTSIRCPNIRYEQTSKNSQNCQLTSLHRYACVSVCAIVDKCMVQSTLQVYMHRTVTFAHSPMDFVLLHSNFANIYMHKHEHVLLVFIFIPFIMLLFGNPKIFFTMNICAVDVSHSVLMCVCAKYTQQRSHNNSVCYPFLRFFFELFSDRNLYQ